MYQNFLVNKDDMMVVITLNRPEKRNPINEERQPLTLPKRLITKNPRAVAGWKLSVNAIAAVAAREVTTVQPDLFIHTEENCGIDRWSSGTN